MKIQIKNKKAIIAIAAAVIVVGVGGTIAYLSTTATFGNNFQTQKYVTEFVEAFDSPDNWKPCDETPKTVTVNNKNTVGNVVARMKLEEYWKLANSQSAGHNTDLPLIKDGVQVAVINFADNWQNDWELHQDGWYYYKREIAPNSSASSLLKSVSFNCNYSPVSGVQYSDDHLSGETIVDEYGGAHYHLYVTIQTAQADPGFTD